MNIIYGISKWLKKVVKNNINSKPINYNEYKSLCKCLNCGYEWLRKIDTSKVCPECKSKKCKEDNFLAGRFHEDGQIYEDSDFPHFNDDSIKVPNYDKIPKTKCLRYTLPDGKKIYVYYYKKMDNKKTRIMVTPEVAKLIGTAIEEKEVYRRRKFWAFKEVELVDK